MKRENCTLSIPLYGFRKRRYCKEYKDYDRGITFNSIVWILASSPGRISVAGGTSLSIPLYGFSIPEILSEAINAYYRFQFHCMDS